MVGFLPLVLTIFLLAYSTCWVSGMHGACDAGWFGRYCMYKCRCQGGKCDQTTGDCLDGLLCEHEWFGPGCQYRSFVANKSVPSFLTDNDDKTCNEGTAKVLQLNTRVLVGWFRIVAKDRKSVEQIELKFGQGVRCEGEVSVLVDSVTRDINCTNQQFEDGVTLTGDGVPKICSFYASIGRNVALRQPTWQTGYIYDYSPDKAVDGGVDRFMSSHTCSHTAVGDKEDANWTLTFSRRPYLLNRIVIHNRDESGFKERLRGFRLEVYDPDLQLTWSHRDLLPVGQSIYDLEISEPKLVRKIQLQALERFRSTDYVLNFCELEAFGEAVCVPGEYGLDCEFNCLSCKDQQCLAATGGCLACPKTPSGYNCEPICPARTYGDTCSQKCNRNCYKRNCDSEDGKCRQCVVGFVGDFCEKKCKDGYFGEECIWRCPSHCKDRKCHHITGACFSCESGYTGDFCQRECENDTYGIKCLKECSSECYQGQCDPIQGSCYACWPGYRGDQCDHKCDRGTFGLGCEERCPVTCEANKCNHVNGTCLTCVPGYSGQHCSQGTKAPRSKSTIWYAILPLLVLVIVGGFLLLRDRTTHDRYLSQHEDWLR